MFYIVNRVTEFYFSFQNIYSYFNKQLGILCYLIPRCFINYVCTAFWAKLTVFTYQGRNAVNKNGVNRSWGILNCRQPWLWGAGMCHKLTRGQYVLLTLIINVIFLRRKKLSTWWKTQMSIYMADQPCIDMHKCSFHWGSDGRGNCAAISPLSVSMNNCFDLFGC